MSRGSAQPGLDVHEQTTAMAAARPRGGEVTLISPDRLVHSQC